MRGKAPEYRKDKGKEAGQSMAKRGYRLQLCCCLDRSVRHKTTVRCVGNIHRERGCSGNYNQSGKQVRERDGNKEGGNPTCVKAASAHGGPGPNDMGSPACGGPGDMTWVLLPVVDQVT